MTAYRWTAADGTTGRLTGRAAEIIDVLHESPADWTGREADDPDRLRAIVHGASIGTEDDHAREELRGLRDAMRLGPVTLYPDAEAA